jgi:hypothetical protein
MSNGLYMTDDCCVLKETKEGPTKLSNFVARIDQEHIYHDGPKATTFLTITGRMQDEELDENGERKHPDGIELPPITIPASEFASLGFVPEKWGMRPIIFPVSGAERDMRTAIQMASKPTKEHIYTHTGWTNIGREPHYLTMSGGINSRGLDTSIKVQLPHELRHYSLPKPVKSKEAFAASLRLVNLGPPEIMWPLVLGCYRACIGPSDFALHLAGRTGTFKSEVCALIQCHYGLGFDARHLPCAWNSTGNALEALLYRGMHAICVVDDFVPVGTAWQVRQLQKNADQIFRGQGNQSGKARLTDVSAMQTTYFPRGLTLSTGEDVPEGHSVRGRMMIMELAPGSIERGKLSAAQGSRELYPQAMADWIQWLAGTNAQEVLTTTARGIRDKYLDVGHTRTPSIIGQLMATMQLLCEYAVDQGWHTAATMGPIYNKALQAVLEAAGKQKDYLEAADPVKAFIETVRYMLTSGVAHVKTRNGGIPKNPDRYGYLVEQGSGELPSYKARGQRIGWVDADAGELLIDQDAMPNIKKHSGGRLAVTAQTLIKRMRETGLITRVDDQRQRSTVRVMLEGHRRQALCMDLAEIMDTEEGDSNGDA